MYQTERRGRMEAKQAGYVSNAAKIKKMNRKVAAMKLKMAKMETKKNTVTFEDQAANSESSSDGETKTTNRNNTALTRQKKGKKD
jgi:phage shock protein A